MKNDYFNQSKYLRHLCGLGLDGDTEHRRLTRGEHFHLIGGSQETHEQMQESTLKLVESLGKRGKTIVTASDIEFYETALEVGMNVLNPHNN